MDNPPAVRRSRSGPRVAHKDLDNPPHAIEVQPSRGVAHIPTGATADHSIKRNHPSKQPRHSTHSFIATAPVHGWTLEAYREAFHLPVKVATCSRGLSIRLSAYAKGQIERSSGFGDGVGVPVALRAGRVPRWRSLAARPRTSPRAATLSATRRSMAPLRSQRSRAGSCGGAASGAGTSGRRLWGLAPLALAVLNAIASVSAAPQNRRARAIA